MAVRSTQGQNRAVRSTQGGVSPSSMYLEMIQKNLLLLSRGRTVDEIMSKHNQSAALIDEQYMSQSKFECSACNKFIVFNNLNIYLQIDTFARYSLEALPD